MTAYYQPPSNSGGSHAQRPTIMIGQEETPPTEQHDFSSRPCVALAEAANGVQEPSPHMLLDFQPPSKVKTVPIFFPAQRLDPLVAALMSPLSLKTLPAQAPVPADPASGGDPAAAYRQARETAHRAADEPVYLDGVKEWHFGDNPKERLVIHPMTAKKLLGWLLLDKVDLHAVFRERHIPIGFGPFSLTTIKLRCKKIDKAALPISKHMAQIAAEFVHNRQEVERRKMEGPLPSSAILNPGDLADVLKVAMEVAYNSTIQVHNRFLRRGFNYRGDDIPEAGGEIYQTLETIRKVGGLVVGTVAERQTDPSPRDRLLITAGEQIMEILESHILEHDIALNLLHQDMIRRTGQMMVVVAVGPENKALTPVISLNPKGGSTDPSQLRAT